jgi:glycerol-3-phosphate acyltransferase PlsX
MGAGEREPIIAVDAMGGDRGPSAVVPGAVTALVGAGDFGLRLYGDTEAIAAELAKLDTEGRSVAIVPCTQDIAMGESPAAAIRARPDAPIVRAMRDHQQGEVQAVVSAGSTGAMVAASLLILGRLSAVDRPAIATVIPTVAGEILMLDAGANVQGTPDQLLSFARMGAVYAREMLGAAEPRIGLLSIGEEESKGTDLVVATHALLRESELNFVGNVESNRLLLGPADVIVTDGYTGNVVLKLVEGFGHFLGALAGRSDLAPDARAAFPAILKLMQERYSYEVYGGALLLGIAGVSVISHGRSSSRAITSAVGVARRQIDLAIPAKLQSAVAI